MSRPTGTGTETALLDVTIDAVRRRLTDLIALGGEEVAEAGARLADALDDGLRIAMIDLLTSLATDLSSQLDDAHIEVRLGADPPLVVVADREPATTTASDEHTARLTLRLPPELKDRITEQAERDGVSVNSWVVTTLHRGADRSRPHPGSPRRLQGRARS